MQSKHKKVVDGIRERKDRVKKEMARRLCVEEANKDIFDILNHSLNARSKDNDAMNAQDERKHLKVGGTLLDVYRYVQEHKMKQEYNCGRGRCVLLHRPFNSEFDDHEFIQKSSQFKNI